MTSSPHPPAEPVPAPLAVTMGEPAGIGGELTLRAWLARGEGSASGGAHGGPLGGPTFFAVDDPGRLDALARSLGWSVPIHAIESPSEAAGVIGHALPVLPIGPEPVNATPGRPDPASGRAVIASIDKAVALVRSGAAGAVVTNPIQKSALYAAGFTHPGHTEYLAALAGMTEPPVMMLAGGGLRVVLATIHVSLGDAVRTLRTEEIVHVGRVTAKALTDDFGIARPRLAVAALNPHAGEGGALGEEETTVIEPAVAALRALGIDATGPAPADTLFHPAARARHDAVVCMYHDQGLIPLKTISFDSGVNVTLGLPFVRTSPDHGTALDIAGKGVASAESLIAAMGMAAEMAAARARRRRF